MSIYYQTKRMQPELRVNHGIKTWWVNDKRHRIDGPAIEFADGYKEYWVNGKQYSKDDWEYDYKPRKVARKHAFYMSQRVYEDTNCELHHLFKPAKITHNGTKQWWKHGLLHRIGGPALESDNDDAYAYYFEGDLHNIDGPARSDGNGHEEYWIDGKQYCKDVWQIEVDNRK